MNEAPMSHYPSSVEEQQKFWVGQLQEAQQHMDTYMKAGKVVADLYNNRAATEREKHLENWDNDNTHRVKASVVFAWVDQSIANMLDKPPVFTVSPKQPRSAAGAPVVGEAMNYWYEESGQWEEDQLMALDAHLMPFAVKKVGWNAVLENQKNVYLSDLTNVVINDAEKENEHYLFGENQENPDLPPITRPTIEQNAKEHLESHEAFLEENLQLPPEVVLAMTQHIKHTKDLLGLGLPTNDQNVKWEAPFASRWAPDDFLLNKEALKGTRDARWTAFRIRQPLHWWKNHRFYSNTSNLEPNVNATDEQGRKLSHAQTGAFKDYEIVEGWEIWAKNFPISSTKSVDLLIVIVETHDRIILHHEGWPYDRIEDYPCVLLKFQDHIKTWLNKPLLTLAGADNIQHLVNEFFDSVLYNMRKSKNVFLYDSHMFNSEEIEKILEAPDGAAIAVNGLSGNAKDSIVPIPYHNIPPGKTEIMEMLQSYMDRTAGTPHPQRNDSNETATEVATIEKRNTARENRRLQRFTDMQIETVRKFWQLHQQYRPDRQYLIDPRTDSWAEVDEEVSRGEYRFRIDVSSKQNALATERKNWLDLYNLLSGSVPLFMQLGMPPPNILKVLEELLRRGYEITEPESILPLGPESDEYQQAIQTNLQDPEKLMLIFGALNATGGDQGPTGAGPGPQNSQQFSASGNAPQRQDQEANRLEGQQ